MTKIEFLQQLYNLLGGLPADERDDIIADFEEHFSVGTSEGKSEEQICSELGDPKSCAAQYLNDEPKKSRRRIRRRKKTAIRDMKPRRPM